ncbi:MULTISPECIES: zinc ABC transporter substrate-binding protein AztC [Agrobacterium]|uniref:Zinc ABC transporter substrate-binding protein AztC n=1 Tax=Agrobacterium tumefaciens TaxID=358 RepID=A0AAF0K977_AGRTU|nr:MULTISPECIES: zinc ABC transporter substrate-binding protein AztC [Agrobacterium]WGM60910.1 zinc ABC transporter substrate-binding protein AztC [Agrobacterium tumefaciens]CVI62607.1 Periplasmic solute binding protein [Agrobacterium salinitolerans str. Hayward 0363]
MKKRTFLFTGLLVASLGTLGAPAYAQDKKLSVVASFSIIGDLAKQVGGDHIELRTLVGPDGDAHVYEPRPADAMALARADVVLVNGLLLEGFMERLIEASQTDAPVTAITDGADILNDPTGGHYHFVDGKAIFHATPNDPHAWQSVGNVKTYVQNIEKAFCAADAGGCEDYKANAATYTEKLTALDADIRAQIGKIPQDHRVAVVAHNAFRYFERDYGISFLSPQGVSTESEASAADVASLIREIREKKAAAVFSENISDARLIEQIASEAGLELGGVLYSDALSPPDGPAPSYIEMMRYNVKTLSQAINRG